MGNGAKLINKHRDIKLAVLKYMGMFVVGKEGADGKGRLYDVYKVEIIPERENLKVKIVPFFAPLVVDESAVIEVKDCLAVVCAPEYLVELYLKQTSPLKVVTAVNPPLDNVINLTGH